MNFKYIFCFTLLLGVGRASFGEEYGYAPAAAEDELMQDLYKRLAGYSPAELQEELYSSQLKELRDVELEDKDPHSTGFIYMSGGAGEGKQHLKPDGSLDNTHQVKSDEMLPFYCHPPNPCPKGLTAKDGCHEFVEDTADYQKEWIKRMQAKGLCSCDEEHMFECESPRGEDDDDEVDDEETNNDVINDVIDSIVNSKADNPYLHTGIKRQSLVAKKSPRVKRDARDRTIDREVIKLSKHRKDNPFLQGKKLRTVAKKG